MRHKYHTEAFVLYRAPARESGATIALLTKDLGLIRARAEGVRKSGAKLAHALQTLSEGDITLVRGKDGWRLSGAVLTENWFATLDRASRLRAGRMASLVLRLIHGESADPELFSIFSAFIRSLPTLPEEAQDTAECLTALRILRSLGLDAGPAPVVDETQGLSKEERRDIVLRINRGLSASGL